MTADLENRLQALDPAACRALLAQARFGRLALPREARPVIVPVLVRADRTTLRLAADPAGGPVPAIGALSRNEAFGLLAQEEVGRLAVAPGGNPLIFPVNYRLDGECVVFRTGNGTKLHAISRSLVGFEADRYDSSGRGWSVTINGWAHEIISSEPKDLRDRIGSLSVEPWAAGDRPYFVRIIPVKVVGYSHCWE